MLFRGGLRLAKVMVGCGLWKMNDSLLGGWELMEFQKYSQRIGEYGREEISLTGHNDMVAKLCNIYMLAIYEGGSKTDHGQEVDRRILLSMFRQCHES
jgi:hypothetical protein